MLLFVRWLNALLLAALLAGGARAQCVSSTPPPQCSGVPFEAVVASGPFAGTVVQSLCVGVPVRFVPCPGRPNVNDLNLVSYGTNANASCIFVPGSRFGPQPIFVLTPTAADVGTLVITENVNVVGAGTVYQRPFPVLATPPPTFTVAPCPNGSALVRVTDTNYTTYFAQTGSGPRVPVPASRRLVLPLNGANSVTLIGTRPGGGPCEGLSTASVPAVAPAPTAPALSSVTLGGALPGGPATFALGPAQAGYADTLVLPDAAAPGGLRRVLPVPPNATTLTLPNPATGCYQLRRSDLCGQTSALSAATLCLLPLSGTPQPGRNSLSFGYPGGAQSISITRNGAPLITLPGTATSYDDAAILCGSRYEYQATAVLAGGERSVSNPLGLVAQAVPAATLPVPALLASFSLQNALELTATLAGGPAPTGSTLRYSASRGGQAAAPFRSASGPGVVTDTARLATLLAAPPCYTVQLVDVCGTASAPSPGVCPALLRATPTDAEGNLIALSWRPLQGPDPAQPAPTALLRLRPDGTELDRRDVTGRTSATDLQPPADRQVLRYRLETRGAGLPAGTVSYSNVAQVVRRPRLTLPNAFTPNGDNLNDVFELKGKFLDNFTLYIVDRNGQEVFRTRDRAQGWDGRINGHAPVPGAYVWRFEQTDETGAAITQTGSVTIIL